MLWVGMLIGAALAVSGRGAWWLLKSKQIPIGASIGVVALVLGALGGSVLWVAQRDEPGGDAEHASSVASLAWPGTTPTLPVAERSPPGATAVQAPPVESLVAGLEARLAERPDDAEGWTLLAQSYAYVSNEEAIERAVGRAVELGVDERMLRDRVASAKHRAQPLDWVEEALRTGRAR